VETTDGLNMASNTRHVQVPIQMSHSYNAQRDRYIRGPSHVIDSSVLHLTKNISSHSDYLLLESCWSYKSSAALRTISSSIP
jgi:hypothetical protein